MSTIRDRIENTIMNAEFVVFGGIALVLFLTAFFALGNNIVLSFFLTLIIVTISYMIYSDIQHKKIAKKTEDRAEELMAKKKIKQLEKEQEEAKCISCTADLEPDVNACSNCGYQIHKYKV